MDKDKLKYVVLTSRSSSKLTETVNEYIENGWEIVGSHQVVIDSTEKRYQGSQTVNQLRYSQTVIRN